MSTIIKFIITYALYFLVALAAALLVAYIETRKFEKHISNKMSTFRESRAARSQSQDEVSAQVDEIDESVDRISESFDRTIEFKRLISKYLDNKIKRTEARENFCESQFGTKKIYTKPQNSTWK